MLGALCMRALGVAASAPSMAFSGSISQCWALIQPAAAASAEKDALRASAARVARSACPSPCWPCCSCPACSACCCACWAAVGVAGAARRRLKRDGREEERRAESGCEPWRCMVGVPASPPASLPPLCCRLGGVAIGALLRVRMGRGRVGGSAAGSAASAAAARPEGAGAECAPSDPAPPSSCWACRWEERL